MMIVMVIMSVTLRWNHPSVGYPQFRLCGVVTDGCLRRVSSCSRYFLRGDRSRRLLLTGVAFEFWDDGVWKSVLLLQAEILLLLVQVPFVGIAAFPVFFWDEESRRVGRQERKLGCFQFPLILLEVLMLVFSDVVLFAMVVVAFGRLVIWAWIRAPVAQEITGKAQWLRLKCRGYRSISKVIFIWIRVICEVN